MSLGLPITYGNINLKTPSLRWKIGLKIPKSHQLEADILDFFELSEFQFEMENREIIKTRLALEQSTQFNTSQDFRQ